jgi:hypothetical protein
MPLNVRVYTADAFPDAKINLEALISIGPGVEERGVVPGRSITSVVLFPFVEIMPFSPNGQTNGDGYVNAVPPTEARPVTDAGVVVGNTTVVGVAVGAV